MQKNVQPYFKEEFMPVCDAAAAGRSRFELPVNNFLKDPSQIEKEINEEIKKNKEFCICMDGRFVPVSEILRMPMEENY